MTESDRRTFLKQSASAVAALAVARCVPPLAAGGLDADTLHGVAEAVLPSDSGPDGVTGVVTEFAAWLEEFEPVAELDHGYISSEITYGPADPEPGWGAQLETLEQLAQRDHGSSFRELDVQVRQAILRPQIGDRRSVSLPPAIRAQHVAVAVMAFFYASPQAADLCYGFDIGDRTCRAIAAASDVPPSEGA